MRYLLTIYVTRWTVFGNVKRKVVDRVATNSFPEASAIMSRADAAGKKVDFVDYSAYFGYPPEWQDNGDTHKPPPESEMLDQELVDEINGQYGEVPF